jgi:hypothetical protein
MKSQAGLMRVDQTCGALMGHITDVSHVLPHDVPWNHYGDRRVQATRHNTVALCRPQCGIRTQSGTSSEGPGAG